MSGDGKKKSLQIVLLTPSDAHVTEQQTIEFRKAQSNWSKEQDREIIEGGLLGRRWADVAMRVNAVAPPPQDQREEEAQWEEDKEQDLVVDKEKEKGPQQQQQQQQQQRHQTNKSPSSMPHLSAGQDVSSHSLSLSSLSSLSTITTTAATATPSSLSSSPPIGPHAKKSAKQCAQRFARVLNPHIKKGVWSPEEDRLLEEGVQSFGDCAWVKVARLLGDRTDIQCRTRWLFRMSQVNKQYASPRFVPVDEPVPRKKKSIATPTAPTAPTAPLPSSSHPYAYSPSHKSDLNPTGNPSIHPPTHSMLSSTGGDIGTGLQSTRRLNPLPPHAVLRLPPNPPQMESVGSLQMQPFGRKDSAESHDEQETKSGQKRKHSIDYLLN